jgi:hypothetical protein
MREVDPTSDLGALVDAAQHSDGPSAEDRERVRKQLFARIASGAAAGAVIATTSATATATTVATTTSLSAVFAKALGAIVLVSAVSATGVYAARQRAAAPRSTVTTARAAPRAEQPSHTQSSQPLILSAPARASVALAAPVTAPEPAPTPAPDIARVEPARGRAAVTPAATRATRAPAPQEPATTAAIEPTVTTPTASTLRDELALITAARAALASGRSADALASLDRYSQRFSRGMLRPESLAARVDALCALGERDRARGVAAAFVAEFPSSALAARVRDACP